MEVVRLLQVKRPFLWMLWFASLALSQSYPEVTSDDECDCYRTNGSDAAYFTTHQFFDFRSLSEYAGVPDIIRDEWNSSHADASSDYFLSDAWTNAWELQNWNNSDVLSQEQDDERAGRETTSDAQYLLVNSPNNVYIEAADGNGDSDGTTFLTMRTSRVGRFQSGAEFASTAAGLHYLSVRMLARTQGGPGAVTAMFTYRGAADLAGVQESDLEIRTADPARKVQYTNQPSYTAAGDEVPEATRNATLPRGGRWTDWAAYRMDWTPTRTTHYVDGDEVAAIAFQNPRDPTQVYFNCWSDGGSWSGVMRDGQQAVLQIRWIEMVYNQTDVDEAQTSRKRDSDYDDRGSCQKVCSIDDTDKVGTAVLIEGAEGTASTVLGLGGWLQLTFWIPLFTMFTLGMS